jgi:transmembrane sensor
MPTPNDRVLYLLKQYSHGISTAGEEKELFQWMATEQDTSTLKEHIANLLNENESATEYAGVDWEQLYGKILQASGHVAEPGTPVRRLFTWKRVAAAILIMIVSAPVIYYFTHRDLKKEPQPVAHHKAMPVQDVAPGDNKATLQLGDGSLVTLDNASIGELTQQDNIKIIKTANGSLAYKGTDNTSAVVYNTLRTPRGGQYHVTLPDGTEVWLNAASSLRYPTAFAGNERNVELTGEAYFEVAKAYSNKKGPAGTEERLPFKVHVKGMEVEVLGTHFNVMAYDNEKTLNTTLLEGRVKVHKGNNSSLLSPGQQVELNSQGDFKMVPDADIDLAVAWKNGYTSFRNMDITGIMRQIERWYDVDVVYEGAVPHRTFSGEVPRAASLSQLLRILEASNINFVIEGRVIKVRP